MRTKKYKVYLREEERKTLKEYVSRGAHTATLVKRAHILLNIDETQGKTKKQTEIAAGLSVSTSMIYKVSKQYAEEGLQGVMQLKRRAEPPITPIVTGEIEAKIIALACSAPPEGRTRWTLRLLETKVVELGIVEAISDNTIGKVLKKHNLNRI